MTTAPAVDERDHATAVIATIKTELAALHAPIGDNVFDYGSVPGEDGNAGDLPETFVVVSLVRRYAEPNGMVKLPSVIGWYVTTSFVATTVNNARLAGLAVTNALEGRRFVVDDVESTPGRFTQGAEVRPDSGAFSGNSVWSFTF